MGPVVLGQQLGKALGHPRAECPQQGRGAPGSEAEDGAELQQGEARGNTEQR